jgi:dihydroxyacetone kinase-like protein
MTGTDETDALIEAVDAVAARIEANESRLTALDSAIGDGDFGKNLSRGFAAASEEVDGMQDDTPTEIVRTVGRTLLGTVGGSAGPLFGQSLMRSSAELEDGLTAGSVAAFAEACLAELAEQGDAEFGEKTVVDALVPVVHVLREWAEGGERPPVEAAARAVEAARRGAMVTTPLRARKGRASYVEWRSVGHADPGAVSVYCIVAAIHDFLEERTDETASPGFDDGDLFEEI